MKTEKGNKKGPDIFQLDEMAAGGKLLYVVVAIVPTCLETSSYQLFRLEKVETLYSRFSRISRPLGGRRERKYLYSRDGGSLTRVS